MFKKLPQTKNHVLKICLRYKHNTFNAESLREKVYSAPARFTSVFALAFAYPSKRNCPIVLGEIVTIVLHEKQRDIA